MRLRLFACAFFLLLVPALTRPHAAVSFQFPTANRALLEPGGGERFYVGTVGREWPSGSFGCVRSEGWQLHEGLDIAALSRDANNEATDPILAAAGGKVAYVNSNAALSNYGKYLVLEHEIEGVKALTTYAHLSEISEELQVGSSVSAGQRIGTMGRTANTRQSISKERAHLHFEINLILNPRFDQWHQEIYQNDLNDHGVWNGRNLIGVDASEIFRLQHAGDQAFSFIEFLRNQRPLFKVVVLDTEFPWLKNYTPLIRRNPTAETEGTAGFEITVNYYGLPYLLIPRAASEIKGQEKFQLLSVDEEEYKNHPCRKLIVKEGNQWRLTHAGTRWLDLLTY